MIRARMPAPAARVLARLPSAGRVRGFLAGLPRAPPAACRACSGWPTGWPGCRPGCPRRPGRPRPAPAEVLAPAPGLPQGARRRGARPGAPRRAGWADRLWEDGYLLPGGVAEIQRLSGLLPLSPGHHPAAGRPRCRGGRGHHRRPARRLGRGHQQDPRWWSACGPAARPSAAAPPCCPGARGARPSAAVPPPCPGAGADRRRRQLRHPAPALAAALKPEAQLVLLDLVRGAAAAAHRPALDRWLALEGRARPPPAQPAAEAAIKAAGFQLHVAEDAGPRQCAAVTEGWARLIGAVRRQGQPAPRGPRPWH